MRWTTTSTAKLAAELTARGHRVPAWTVAKLLKAAGCAQHRDRDVQFGYLNSHVERFQAGGDPVISVDTKKYAPDQTKGGRPVAPMSEQSRERFALEA